MAEIERREQITLNGEVVGVIGGYSNYINCLFVKPEHRRKGLAREAVLKFVEGNLDKGIKIHILNNNAEGIAFFNSVFELNIVYKSEIDTLYEILGINKENEG